MSVNWSKCALEQRTKVICTGLHSPKFTSTRKLRRWPSLEIGSLQMSFIKMRSYEIHVDSKWRLCEDTQRHTQREEGQCDTVSSEADFGGWRHKPQNTKDCWPAAGAKKTEERTDSSQELLREQAPPTPWFQPSPLHNCERIHFSSDTQFVVICYSSCGN